MKNKTLFILIVAIVSFILGGLLVFRATRKSSSTSKPIAETKLNQSVWVIGRDKNGDVTNDWVELAFTKAEKTKSVLVKGKSATAKDDKYFLVLYFEVKNKSNRALYILPMDLVRLVKSEDKHFAPSVHQSIVEVRPISTKVSNVGFVVEKNEKDFVLKVGEVGGEKNEVKVNF